MGKALIIKGADFSNSSFDTIDTEIGLITFLSGPTYKHVLDGTGADVPSSSTLVHVVEYSVQRAGRVYVRGRAGEGTSGTVALCAAYDSNGDVIPESVVLKSGSTANYTEPYVIPSGAATIKVCGNDTTAGVRAAAQSTPFTT